MYHVTKSILIPSIIKNGLIPQVGPNSQMMDDDSAIWLFSSMDEVEDAVMNWLGDQFNDDISLSIIEVDVSGLNIQKDVGPGYYTKDYIAPERIVVTARLDENFDDDYQSFPLNWSTGRSSGRHGGNASGGGFPQSTHLQSRPPKPWPRFGQTGDPNQAPTMMASRLMQNTSTDDDIKYWMGDPDDPEDVGATFDPPAQFPSYHSDYQRVSHHWMNELELEEDEGYVSHMEDLFEIFGLRRSDLQKSIAKYRKLNKSIPKYRDRAKKALRAALVHKKFKEKILKMGQLSSRRIEMIERYEDQALNILKPLYDDIEESIQFLKVSKDDFSGDPLYPSTLAFYEDMGNKINQALFSIRETTKLHEMWEKGMLNEMTQKPIQTSVGTYKPKGKTGTFYMFVSELGIRIGIRFEREDSEYQVYDFDNMNWGYGPTIKDAIENAAYDSAIDEVSAVGGGAMGAPGQPSGQIRGHIGPLGSDNRSPHLKKKKKKYKHYEPSMRAFGGASEVD